jgi:hypothetical protein
MKNFLQGNNKIAKRHAASPSIGWRNACALPRKSGLGALADPRWRGGQGVQQKGIASREPGGF